MAAASIDIDSKFNEQHRMVGTRQGTATEDQKSIGEAAGIEGYGKKYADQKLQRTYTNEQVGTFNSQDIFDDDGRMHFLYTANHFATENKWSVYFYMLQKQESKHGIKPQGDKSTTDSVFQEFWEGYKFFEKDVTSLYASHYEHYITSIKKQTGLTIDTHIYDFYRNSTKEADTLDKNVGSFTVDAVFAGQAHHTSDKDSPNDNDHDESYAGLAYYGFTPAGADGEKKAMHMINAKACSDGGADLENLWPSNTPTNNTHKHWESIFGYVSKLIHRENYERRKKVWPGTKINMLVRAVGLDEEGNVIWADQPSVLAVRVRVYSPAINLRTYNNGLFSKVPYNWAGFITRASIVEIFKDGTTKDVNWSTFLKMREIEHTFLVNAKEEQLSREQVPGETIIDDDFIRIMTGLPGGEEKFGTIQSKMPWVLVVNQHSIHTRRDPYNISRGAFFGNACFMQERSDQPVSCRPLGTVTVGKAPPTGIPGSDMPNIATGDWVKCDGCEVWWPAKSDDMSTITAMPNWFCGDWPYDGTRNDHPYDDRSASTCRSSFEMNCSDGGGKKSLKKRKTKIRRKRQRKTQRKTRRKRQKKTQRKTRRKRQRKTQRKTRRNDKEKRKEKHEEII